MYCVHLLKALELYVIVITQDEYDILVITQSEAKPRMSVNNKDIIRMSLGYNPKGSTNQCFLCDRKQWLKVMFTYQSFFCH